MQHEQISRENYFEFFLSPFRFYEVDLKKKEGTTVMRNCHRSEKAV